MNIVDVITWKYPNTKFNKDVLVSDDGEGQYIESWNIDNVEQPSTEKLLEWSDSEEFNNWLLNSQKEKAISELQRQRGNARKPVEPHNIYLQEMALAGKFVQGFLYKTLKTSLPSWEPQEEMFPVLYGQEAQTLGLTADQMADLVVSKGLDWLQFNDVVDTTNFITKQKIMTSQNSEEIEVLIEDVNWPQLPLQDS